jgi:hypothetical protein
MADETFTIHPTTFVIAFENWHSNDGLVLLALDTTVTHTEFFWVLFALMFSFFYSELATAIIALTFEAPNTQSPI